MIDSIEMSGFQRVINAVQGNQQNRPPWGLILSLYGSKLIGTSLQNYYTNPSLYYDGQKAIIETFNPDIITTPFVLAYEGEAFGSALKYFNDSPPQLKKPVIDSYKGIKKIQKPILHIGSKAYMLDAAKFISAKYKYDKFIAGITLSSIDLPMMIMGIEGWIDTLLFHRKEAELLLEITGEYFVEYANAMFDNGIDVLVLPSMFSNPSIITDKIIEDLTLNVLEKVFQQINGPIIIHHGGAKVVDFLSYFDKLPNIVGFIIDDRESLSVARSTIADKLLLGNFNLSTLIHGNAKIIKDKTMDMLDDRQSDSNFIFLNSGPDVSLNTPQDNIQHISTLLHSYSYESNYR